MKPLRYNGLRKVFVVEFKQRGRWRADGSCVSEYYDQLARRVSDYQKLVEKEGQFPIRITRYVPEGTKE